MISYAQNNEDVLLNRVFGDVECGFYVDVGAGHPIVDSVTKHFYQKGWKGINIEPRPDMFARLEADRQRDVNLRVGVADVASTATFYHVLRDGPRAQDEAYDMGGLSTFSSELAAQYRELGDDVKELPTKLIPLASIFEEHAPREITFLKIDVEGFERQVLSGANVDVWRPRVVIVESIDPVEQMDSAASWESILTRHGYSNSHFDGINSFFVREEDLEELGPRLRAPVNVLDDYISFRHVNATTEVEHLATELKHLKRRTGPRSLAVGLKIARHLHRWTGV